MTGNNVLLDTNIISAWLKGDADIADKIDNADFIAIPVVVVGELNYGAQYSTNVKRNTTNINKVISSYNVLNIDTDTASHYGVIKALLRRKGKPIPENDIWIAALAKQHNFVLATRDKHFTEVEGLTIVTW